ncbi:MAG: ABC transporter ATP-binding protein [Solibacillus sp.]|jgi:ABC-2 type transport system ATP-binding protein|uniref:ABC transporter ATP-binding protein n=1 Tax=unclassified Solibacillus TaxID=2637870 RepID=UPI0030FC326A
MNAIEMKYVSKQFKNFRLNNLSFTVECGTIAGFIGQNAAGKSSTIKLILNLLKKQEGEILIFGKDHVEHEVELKAQIGVVFDELHVPDYLTPKELDVLYGHVYLSWDRPYFDRLLLQLDVPKYDTVKTMSKGTKMKLALCLALAHRPKLLILDEPTSGLDPIVRDEVLEILQGFMENEEHAILISSHITTDLEKIADTITFIHEGEILFSDNKDELLYGYGIWKGSHEEAHIIPKHSIIGTKDSAFGISHLVIREYVNPIIQLEKPTIDDIMLYFVKGRRRIYDSVSL